MAKAWRVELWKRYSVTARESLKIAAPPRGYGGGRDRWIESKSSNPPGEKGKVSAVFVFGSERGYLRGGGTRE